MLKMFYFIPLTFLAAGGCTAITEHAPEIEAVAEVVTEVGAAVSLINPAAGISIIVVSGALAAATTILMCMGKKKTEHK